MNSRTVAREDHTVGAGGRRVGEEKRDFAGCGSFAFWWQETVVRSAQLPGKLQPKKSQNISKAFEAVDLSSLSSCFSAQYIRFVHKRNL